MCAVDDPHDPLGEDIPLKFSFSYSRWAAWEECPRKYKYKHIDRLPDPPSPAMERGSRIHEEVAEYVSGVREERPASLDKFTVLADGLRVVPEKQKMVESQLAFDEEGRRCEWFGQNAYYRFIWDVAYWDEGKTRLNMADWKTGRPRGSYDAQMQIFAIPAYWLLPDLEEFNAHLVYLDTGDTVSVTYTREQFLGPAGDPAARDGIYGMWMANIAAMASDRAFRATPSHDACRWCPYHAKKGGPCKEGF